MKLFIKKHPRITLLAYAVLVVLLFTGPGNMYGSITDWINQHTVFPDAFRKVFYDSGNVLPDFLYNIGGGQNIFNYTYYGLVSPVILPSYFLPFIDMEHYIMLVSVVLYIASGILTYDFIRHHFGEKFGFLSALVMLTTTPMTFHFHHHPMFVWYMPFLLMALIGIDRSFEKKRNGLFVVSTVLIILTNYYYSVCCLLCLFAYAVFRVLRENENLKFGVFVKKMLYQAYLFIIPVLMCGFILLPTAFGLASNGRSYDVQVDIYSLIVPEFMENFLSHYSPAVTGTMFVGIIAHLIDKRKDKAAKFMSSFLLVILVVPIFTYALNGMLYVRGKVLIPLIPLFIYVLCDFIKKINENPDFQFLKKAVIIAVSITLFFGIFRLDNLLISLLVLVAGIGVVYFRNKTDIIWCFVLAILIIPTAIFNNFTEEFVSYDYYDDLRIEDTEKLLSDADTDELERSLVYYKDNDNSNRVYSSDFYNTTVYSSTSNSTYQEFYENCFGNNEPYRNCFMIMGSKNELFHTFMGTKYIVSAYDPGIYYDKVKSVGNLSLYENKNAYPIMYKSGKLLNESAFNELSYPYSAAALMNYTVVPDEAGEASAEFDFEKYDLLETSYEFINPFVKVFKVTLDEKYKGKVMYLSFDIINSDEYFNEDDLFIGISRCDNLLTQSNYIYYNGNNRFEYCISLEDSTELDVIVSPGMFKIENIEMYFSDKIINVPQKADNIRYDTAKSEFSCSVDAQEGEYLVTSIPYSEGFKAYVNGKETEVTVVNKAFVGVKLESGRNEVVIEFNAPYLDVGIIVSLIGLALFLFELVRKKYEKR